jgi:hypothetical protein
VKRFTAAETRVVGYRIICVCGGDDEQEFTVAAAGFFGYLWRRRQWIAAEVARVV